MSEWGQQKLIVMTIWRVHHSVTYVAQLTNWKKQTQNKSIGLLHNRQELGQLQLQRSVVVLFSDNNKARKLRIKVTRL